MGEMNRLRIAICGALAAGALATVPAMAHNDDVDQPDDTTATMSSQTSTTTAGSTTSGYGAATASAPSTSSSSAATAGDSTDADQVRTNSTTDPRYSTGTSSATDTTGPNRADLYSSDSNQASSGTSSADAQSTYSNSEQSNQQSGSMTTDADQSTRAQASRSGSSMAPDVVWYIFPVAMQAQSDQMSKGCWVQLYSGDDFEGRYVSVVGPAQIREMVSPYGTGMNNWESAIVGPNATVTTYDGENFDSRNATLRAGQRYPDLDDSKLGLFDDIESMKVECTQSSQPGR